jgi:hypothetical protein
MRLELMYKFTISHALQLLSGDIVAIAIYWRIILALSTFFAGRAFNPRLF